MGLGGCVALLLWGIHMVGAAAQRALGGRLRLLLARSLRNRLAAFAAGLGITALLQSSTATALLTTSLVAGGLVDLVPGLAVMLGANVGTTLIVQAASFDVAASYPALLLAGVIAHQRGRRIAVREAGSALVGLGLALLALHLLTDIMRPVESAQSVRDLLHAVTGDPLLNVVLAGLLAWAAHSSVAAVLFIMSLAGSGAVQPDAAVAMVIGANLGSALNPLFAALGSEEPAAKRLAAGNLATRLAGCAVFLPFADRVAPALAWIDMSPARAVADFHVLFNLVLATLFIGLLPVVARTLGALVPDRVAASDPGLPRYLDEAALATPAVALSNASREVLRMADFVEAMLRGSQDGFRHDDRDRLAAVSRMDDTLDRLFGAVQRYLGAIPREALSPAEAQRLADVLAFAINLEHVGDIVDKNLIELARKRIVRSLRLSGEDRERIDAMHARVLDHMQLSVTVLMTGDPAAARRLVEAKEQFRKLERQATERHVAQMRSGLATAIEASALQLDVTRDLKRIDSHIAATAYGLLEQSGQLRTSRLAG
jgi:phosphate:Na+ symporter